MNLQDKLAYLFNHLEHMDDTVGAGLVEEIINDLQPPMPNSEYEAVAEIVCKEFLANPKEINNNRRRHNVEANKVIAKVLNLRGYSHSKIADMVHSNRVTVTSRIIDFNTQYRFNKRFQSATDNVLKSLQEDRFKFEQIMTETK